MRRAFGRRWPRPALAGLLLGMGGVVGAPGSAPADIPASWISTSSLPAAPAPGAAGARVASPTTRVDRGPVAPARASGMTAMLEHVRRRGLPRAAPTVPGADPRLSVTVRLQPGERAADLGLLEVAPGVGTRRIFPSEMASFVAAHPGRTPLVAPPRRTWLDRAGRWTQAPAFRDATGLDGEGVVVGIIDTGIDGRHADFFDAEGKSRVAWILQQGAPLGMQAELEQQYGCTDPDQSPCIILSGADIDGLRASESPFVPFDVDGHGTHVASIAAGNGGPSEGTPVYVGVAPRATVIVASPSPGGGFDDADILRAASFVFERADAMGLPAVVNLSLGSDFGPHDGTSVLETGLSAMVGPDHPGRAIVVAAGNSGAIYGIEGEGPFGIHTETNVSPNATTRVTMRTAGADGMVNGAGFVWVTFRPDDDVAVGLEGPGGQTLIDAVGPGEEAGTREGDPFQAAVINNRTDNNSDLTAATNGAIVFFSGEWDAQDTFAVTLRGRGHAQLWVTPTGGAGQGPAGLGLVFERAKKAGTIAVPASAPDLIAVGCTLNRTSWFPIQPAGTELQIESFGGQPATDDSTCFFSASGPTPDGLTKPELLAPGGFVAAAMSAGADPRAQPLSIFSSSACPDGQPCTLLSERHALTSGTSMSAPFVAGAAALLLQADPTLTQLDIRDLLQAGAQRPVGLVPYDFQMGPGKLDLLATLQVWNDRRGAGPVDAIASYYVLSSPYLRPDPDWSVEGTVALRHANLEVAMGIPAEDLTVRVDGGFVTRPVTRVRGGLYRFAISAPVGSGGGVVDVDVSYRGQSLGRRRLPIGVDTWAALGGVQPVGGCHVAAAIGAAGSSPHDSSPLQGGKGRRTPVGFGAAAALFLLSWRRRRGFSSSPV
ncbi:MAG: S8 family serine peptidase [Myxococcota bacterium]